MAITLTTAYKNELKSGSNSPNIILEVALDSGTVKWGVSDGGFNDVNPIVNGVASLQNKIDTKKGYSTRGQISFTILGRDNFKDLIKDEYLKNRRVTRKDGFVASGFQYSDYASTFTGIIKDWSRKGDTLTVVVADDTTVAFRKIPEENATKTQFIDYTNTNCVDIMTNILSTQLSASNVDTTKFNSERDIWLGSWTFSRVITEPDKADKYLNELQVETNSFIIHDGENISFKVFAPTVPDTILQEWSDDNNIKDGTFSEKAGYDENFFNRVVVYYDYDESGDDKEENYESASISTDATSISNWGETKTKVIKSKWMRTYLWGQPTNITGVTVYNTSTPNGLNAGKTGSALAYNNTNNTLTWTAPDGTTGATVTLNKDGKYTIYDTDTTKFIRVVVAVASLPVSDQSDTINITALTGGSLSSALATKHLLHYSDPVGIVTFTVDINDVEYNSNFIKPTDFKNITTDEAFDKGQNTWSSEEVMLTSVRPDFAKGTIQVEAVQTRYNRKYGFIGELASPDYGSATDTQKERAYIGDASNLVGAGTEDGYYII